MKKMKLKILVFCIFVLTLSFTGYYLYKISFAHSTHLMTYQDKISRLRSIDSPKAIFVGGSGTHFGISAELFQEETHIQTVNMGLHASIGMNTYLKNIETYVKEGDYLFICPEYDYYCTPWIKTDSQNVEFSVLYGNNLADFLFSSKDALPNTLYVGWTKWADIIKQVFSLSIAGRTTEAYSRYDSNQFGDFVNYKENYILSHSYSTFTEVDEDALKQLLDTIECFQNKGVKVVLLFPGYAEFAYHDNESIIDSVYTFAKDNDITTYFDPLAAVFQEDCLYDTVYHLNDIGKHIYTEMVINAFLE